MDTQDELKALRLAAIAERMEKLEAEAASEPVLDIVALIDEATTLNELRDLELARVARGEAQLAAELAGST